MTAALLALVAVAGWTVAMGAAGAAHEAMRRAAIAEARARSATERAEAWQRVADALSAECQRAQAATQALLMERGRSSATSAPRPLTRH